MDECKRQNCNLRVAWLNNFVQGCIGLETDLARVPSNFAYAEEFVRKEMREVATQVYDLHRRHHARNVLTGFASAENVRAPSPGSLLLQLW